MVLTLVIIYIFITLSIGFYFSRKIKSSKDFALAGRRLPLFISASAFFATWFGAETVMGASTEFAEGGLLSVIEDPFGAALGLILVGLFLVKHFYKKNILSLGDFYREKFGKRFELWSSVVMVISFFGWIAAQLVAFGIVLNLLSGWGETTCMIIGALVVVAYTYSGGMFAISFSDFIQSVVIVGGMLFVAIEFSSQAGGVSKVMDGVPDHFYRMLPDGNFNSISWYMAAWLTLGLGSLPSQDVFQRMMAAKSERTAKHSAILGAGMYLTIAFLPLFLVLCAKVIMPEIIDEDSRSTLVSLVMSSSSVWVKVLFFGALLSAVMSTASAAILAPSVVLAENIIKPHQPHLSDKQLLKLLRASVLIICAFSLGLSMLRGNIYELVGESSAMGVVALFVPLIMGIYDKKPSAKGAMLSMILGTLTWLIFLNTIDNYPALIPALVVSFLGYIVGKGLENKTTN